jgi:hypothetical protein
MLELLSVSQLHSILREAERDLHASTSIEEIALRQQEVTAIEAVYLKKLSHEEEKHPVAYANIFGDVEHGGGHAVVTRYPTPGSVLVSAYPRPDLEKLLEAA